MRTFRSGVQGPYIRPVLLLIASLAIASCGGGGTSNSSSTVSQPSLSPPPLPRPVYTGTLLPATIDTAKAGNLAQSTYFALSLANQFDETLIADSSEYATSVDTTIHGSRGGTVTIAGYPKTSSGWLEETFDNFVFSPPNSSTTYTANGTILFETQAVASGSSYTIGYSDYHVYGGGVDEVLNGTASEVVAAINNVLNTTLTLNFSLQDFSTGFSEELSNFVVQYTGLTGFGPTPMSFAGRLFTENVGYVDVASDGEEYIMTGNGAYLPIGGGDLILSDTSAHRIHIAPLNSYFFSVGIDSAGNGLVTQASRYAWSTIAADTSPTSSGGPIAVAVQKPTTPLGIQYVLTPGGTALLDGRFSHSPDGGFLTFHWFLRHAAPGSTAHLTQSTSATTSFVADTVGDYLVELDVTEGSTTSVDTVVVSVTTPAALSYATAGLPAYKMDPVGRWVVGKTLTLDARDSVLADGPVSSLSLNRAQPTYQWTLEAPTASTATLSDPSSATPSFVPDVPGYYTVTVKPAPGPGALDFGEDTEVITVGAHLKYDHPVQLLPEFYAASGGIVGVAADINNDGLPDMAFASRGSSGGSSQINLLTNTGDGGFSAPRVLALPGTSSADALAVGDLNGDGRPDIAVLLDDPSAISVLVYLQNPDGTWASPLTLSYSVTCGSSDMQIWIAKLFGASTNSLAVLGCPGLIDWTWNAGFGAATVTTVISGTNNGLTGFSYLIDADGDGVADLVGPGWDNVQGVFLVPGRSNGTFASPVTLPMLSDPTVADVNGDGEPDLLGIPSNGGSAPDAFDIDYGTGSGFSTTATSLPFSGSLPDSLEAADVNGDGLGDIVMPGATGLMSYEQQTDHTFVVAPTYPLSVHSSVGPGQALWVTDVNKDGIPDLVVFDDNFVGIYYGRL